jgi:hypothetical protein
MKPRPISTDVMGAHPMAQEPGAGGVGRAKERVFGGESSWLQILSQKLEAGGDESVSASKAGVGGKLSKKEQYRIAVEQAKVQMQTGMYVCTCVCMCVRVYVCVYVCMYVCTCVCMCVRVYVCVYVE